MHYEVDVGVDDMRLVDTHELERQVFEPRLQVPDLLHVYTEPGLDLLVATVGEKAIYLHDITLVRQQMVWLQQRHAGLGVFGYDKSERVIELLAAR